MNDEQSPATPTTEVFLQRLTSGRADLGELALRLEGMLERIEGPTPEETDEAKAEPEPASYNARMDRGLSNLQQIIDRIHTAVRRLEEHV